MFQGRWISPSMDLEQIIQQIETVEAQALKEDCSWMSFAVGDLECDLQVSRMWLCSSKMESIIALRILSGSSIPRSVIAFGQRIMILMLT
ncbi:unnamed protein product [Darwinula stevensoni]|uniref:Uncharacterized protein n=1 Tax=Darwinula stevensoni TaxID=69355 RepID=A0A7R9A6K0_9CRUS|nr:unnamed protein product [Darwinula stevensoni]CAG0889446.1 unnamed protein product [Darwinula stevensoni]